MKNKLLIFVFFACSMSVNGATWDGANWIWQNEDGPANSWVSFRKTVQVDVVPENVSAKIAVDSKFWLWVNGEMVVFEGGVSRGPSQAGEWDRENNITPSNSWYEEVDLTPYLQQGKNTIALLVWYWGRETHKGTHIDSEKGGLLFHCGLGGKNIISDATWKMKQHPGYDENSGDNGTSIVQYNVKYDARNDLGDWSSSAWYTPGYDDSSWAAAVEKGQAGSAPWYDLKKNYVPRLVNHGLKDYENNSDLNFPFVSDGNPIVCQLPFNKQITPYFEIESDAGKVIKIVTDNRLNRISANYTTKTGDQSFECFSWMNGHSVIYDIPAGVSVKALKYRWMSVGEMAGTFKVSDPFYERLWWMGRNTLFVCARDNFMDCPDRERALWIGDVADQAGYLFYSMDDAGRQLLKKAIYTTFNFSENNVIGSLGPRRVRELPAQSLQFIAQVVWPYYFNTGDLAALEAVYAYVYDYLALWEMDPNGLPKYRKWESPDNWDWVDWGVEGTIDKSPIQFALYFMALESAKNMAVELGENTHVSWYENRLNSILDAFNRIYWKDGFYSSNVSEFKDDRLNALAILSGIADSAKLEPIVENVLIPNHYSSPHFEWMAEAAMCEAGKHAEALNRMKARYKSQVNTAWLTTLYETFPSGGSYNHAWNAPNTILNKYIAGIEPTKVAWSEYKVCPTLLHLTSFEAFIPSVKGDITVEVNKTDKQYTMNLISPQQTTAIVGFPKRTFDIFELKAENQTIWKNGQYVNGVSGISWQGEDESFILFKVESGTWNFEASGNAYINIPATIEAEDYNFGGEGFAWHDSDADDKLGHGRPGESVDVGILNDVKYVGSTEVGEWLTYNINVGETRNYNFLFDYAADNIESEISVLLNDSVVIPSHVFTQTDGMDSFETDTIFNVMLMSGSYILKIKVETGGFNLDKMHIALPDPVQATYHGTPIAIPGIFEAEDYDLGGEGLAWHDKDEINLSGEYRTDGVDIGTGGSGYVIGYTNAGEWLEYTIDVAEDADHDIVIYYTSGRPGGGAKIGFSLPNENLELISSFDLPVTGTWSDYRKINAGNIFLAKGQHVLRISVVERGFNLDWVEFKKATNVGSKHDLTNRTDVFPNPSSSGQFHLSEYQKWAVYSLMGIKIQEGEGEHINLSKSPGGTYILKTMNTIVKLVLK